jgi:uncharacterized protein
MTTKSDRPELDKELVEAAFVCDFMRVRDLLARGAHPDARDEDGRTPLMSALLGGSLSVMALLLESKADVNARDLNGWTALHFAAQEHLPEMARLLVFKGADPNAQDEDGNSVLWRAVFSAYGRDEIVKLLIEHGAKDDLANKAGETPKQLAERIGSDVFDLKN